MHAPFRSEQRSNGIAARELKFTSAQRAADCFPALPVLASSVTRRARQPAHDYEKDCGGCDQQRRSRISVIEAREKRRIHRAARDGGAAVQRNGVCGSEGVFDRCLPRESQGRGE
jgi:hypothetical protein